MLVHSAKDLADAAAFLTANPGARIVAGGTDLLPRISQKLESHPALCYVDRLPETSGVRRMEDGSLFVGASVRLWEAAELPELAGYAAVAAAASKVASPQIRNQATIGGNILQENRCMYFNNHVPWSDVNHCFKWGGDRCFQYKKSPECVALFQSDVAPALIAFGALALIYGPEGERRLPVEELYLSAGRKALAPNEILLGVLLPPLGEGTRSAYARRTIRGSFDFPLLSCAVRARIVDGTVAECDAVFGAAGVRPARLPAAASLAGRRAEELPEAAKELLGGVAKVIAPFQDTRVNAPVRVDLAKSTLLEAIEKVAD